MKREILTILCIFGYTNICWAATPLVGSDSQQHELAGNMMMEQEHILSDTDKIAERERKSNGRVYISSFIVDTQALQRSLPPPKALLRRYSGRELDIHELQQFTQDISLYYRKHGYPAATAFLPRQEIKDGIITVKVLPGILDKIILKNNSQLDDRFVKGFLRNLQSGMLMRSTELETALANLNGLPGVSAKGIIEAGDELGGSSLTVVVEREPVIEGAVYIDNYGGKYSGRYRYGVQLAVSEPFKNGDKFFVSGMLSNENMKNYNIGYETAINKNGGRIGFRCAESDYILGDYFSQAGAVGTAKTVSVYGSQLLSNASSSNIRMIYGYEHNRLNDELRIFNYSARKSSDVFYVGFTGSFTENGSYTGYSTVWRAGNLKMRSEEAQLTAEAGGASGSFSKANFDLNHIRRLGNLTQLYVFGHGQLAGSNLDSSEQFYLGGADAVRAYPQGEAGGDSGYQATAELRYQTPVKGMSMTLFADVGEVLARKDGNTPDPHRRLAGWGIGAVYSLNRSLYARLDYARKIKGESYRSEAENKNGRLWFRLYKLF